MLQRREPGEGQCLCPGSEPKNAACKNALSIARAMEEDLRTPREHPGMANGHPSTIPLWRTDGRREVMRDGALYSRGLVATGARRTWGFSTGLIVACIVNNKIGLTRKPTTRARR